MVTFYALPAIFFLGVKLVNSQITDAAPWDSRNIFFKVISRINFFFSDIIIANSNAGLKTYQITAEKGRVIYNGVSMGRFNVLESRNSIKMKYGLNREYCIVMVASFSINKDYNLFIDIAAEIEKTRDDIMFLAVGTGKFELAARERVEQLGLTNINFLGSCSNVEVILKGCDVGVLFSPNGEGISNSILEYQAMGLPTIVNDLGGNREVINDGYNGFLTNLSEKDTIITKLLLILDNNILYQQMSLNAKQTVRDKFVVDKMLVEFLQIYKEVGTL